MQMMARMLCEAKSTTDLIERKRLLYAMTGEAQW